MATGTSWVTERTDLQRVKAVSIPLVQVPPGPYIVGLEKLVYNRAESRPVVCVRVLAGSMRLWLEVQPSDLKLDGTRLVAPGAGASALGPNALAQPVLWPIVFPEGVDSGEVSLYLASPKAAHPVRMLAARLSIAPHHQESA